jgi:hypothetical protein
MTKPFEVGTFFACLNEKFHSYNVETGLSVFFSTVKDERYWRSLILRV